MPHQTIQIDKHEHMLHIVLNRPSHRNAINDTMIYELTQQLESIGSDEEIRVVMLSGNGKSFCAGADIHWMRSMGDESQYENAQDADSLANLLYTLHTLPQPTIGVAHGHVYGGGIGLLAACDSVFSSDNSEFCLSEVKIGLIPATIFPYVIRKIGASKAGHYSLSATPFNADEARRNGLVNEVFGTDLLDKSEQHARQICMNSPAACRRAKALLQQLHPISDNTRQVTTAALADIRRSDEGQEGLQAFLDKRKPTWIVEKSR